jgi:surface polysaccharide O-acyltransferase-like enzyme
MSAAPRAAGLDALKGAVTLLVVLHHTAITYGAIGGWYYKEVPTDGRLQVQALVFFCTFNQAWFMGLFFLLAGYFTPPSLARKGLAPFVRERLLRLGLPLLVYGWLIGPLTIALAATARGQDFATVALQLLGTGRFENGPLWFAQALLLFTAVALAGWRLRGLRLADLMQAEPAARPWPAPRTLALAALGTGAAAWALRQAWPVGMNVWGLQLGYFASYVLLFAFGCAAARHQWLQRVPPALARQWRWVARIALPVLPVLYLLGARWPALRGAPLDAVYAFWEPLVAWGLLLGLLLRWPQRFEAGLPGAWQALARRAFAIYVIHPPVVVGVALAWRSVAAPPLLKFIVTGGLACALCIVLAGGLLKLPGVRRVL